MGTSFLPLSFSVPLCLCGKNSRILPAKYRAGLQRHDRREGRRRVDSELKRVGVQPTSSARRAAGFAALYAASRARLLPIEQCPTLADRRSAEDADQSARARHRSLATAKAFCSA